MTQETIKSLKEMLDERPDINTTDTFNQLWEIYAKLREKINRRFELHPDASTADLQPYEGLEGTQAKGFLSGWSGPEIDWMVHSWVGNPRFSFSNMHLTLWLGPQTNVPHLAFALGTVPDIFFYMDYVPRVDLMIDVDYLDRYYEPVNERYLNVRQKSDLALFTSKSLYVRQALSETVFCYTCPPTPENLTFVHDLAHEMLDRWLIWLDEAKPLPAEERPAMAARDLTLRRHIAERDPANSVGEKLFGKSLTDRLVRALWGGDRVTPRPQ